MNWESLLRRVNPGMVVALEGAPIYLCDSPTAVHAAANKVVAQIAEAVQALGARPELHVLLDDFTCEEADGHRESYLNCLPLCPSRVVLESELVQPARELFGRLMPKRIMSGGKQGNFRRLTVEPKPVLITDSGRPACALLDTAFQLGKKADISFVIHPRVMEVSGSRVSFGKQQWGVLRVIKSVRRTAGERPQFPWPLGLVHVWLDEVGQIAGISPTRI